MLLDEARESKLIKTITCSAQQRHNILLPEILGDLINLDLCL